MSTLSARFIDELGENVIKDFAPSIADEQIINAYIGEEMTPYQILGENISATPSNAPVLENHTLTAAEALAESFTLENSVATGTENNILLSVCGVAQIPEVDFSVSGNTISWDNKALHEITFVAGDTFSISYYPEIE